MSRISAEDEEKLLRFERDATTNADVYLRLRRAIQAGDVDRAMELLEQAGWRYQCSLMVPLRAIHSAWRAYVCFGEITRLLQALSAILHVAIPHVCEVVVIPRHGRRACVVLNDGRLIKKTKRLLTYRPSPEEVHQIAKWAVQALHLLDLSTVLYSETIEELRTMFDEADAVTIINE